MQVRGGGMEERREAEGSSREGKVDEGRSDWRLCGWWRQTGSCVQDMIREAEGNYDGTVEERKRVS